MPSYSPSTIGRIGDIKRGLIVSTATLNATAALVSTPKNLFTVYGHIRVLDLQMEVITTLGADATTLTYSFDASTPAVAAADFSGASASVANLAIGKRATLIGTALNSAPIIAAQPAISLASATFVELGCTGGVGIITSTGGTADATSGTVKFTLMYVPITEGAYAQAS
jgi:hypothetical protein